VIEPSQIKLAGQRVRPRDEPASGEEDHVGRTELLRLLHRWRDAAGKAGYTITRIAVAFEAGRDGL
jgi:hypothetical protein